jgi:hypothetical protein
MPIFAVIAWHDPTTGARMETEVASLAELNGLLDTIRLSLPPAEPQLVEVTRSNGDSLAIGLGTPIFVDDRVSPTAAPISRPITILNFVAADKDPPYYSSIGVEAFRQHFVYYFGGQWSEFLSHNAIPLSTATEAISEFVTTSHLPGAVSWDQD